MKLTRMLGAIALALSVALPAVAFTPDKPECVAPANPGGGFDLTCRLATQGLQELNLLKEPMRVTFLPGGIGAVAYNTIISQRPADPNVIVAFSGGSLLNLAQKKFGQYTVGDVRWISAIGADYGVLVVRKDAPWKTLSELMEAVKANPAKVVFGGAGSVGSQDWMKSALIARQAGVDPKSMRYVAFEGGGSATTALLGGHVQVFPGDASEMAGQLDAGTMRVLAVLAPERLSGKFADIPTAKEQGFPVDWTVIRGFYTGPKVSDEAYRFWVETFEKMLGTREFAELREQRGLFPFAMTGEKLDAYVKAQVEDFRKLAEEAGLIK